MKSLNTLLFLLAGMPCLPITQAGEQPAAEHQTIKRIKLSKFKNYQLIISFDEAEWQKSGVTDWKKVPQLEPIILNYQQKGTKLSGKKAVTPYFMEKSTLVDFAGSGFEPISITYKTEFRYKKGNEASLEFCNQSEDVDGSYDLFMTLTFESSTAGVINDFTIWTIGKPKLRNVQFRFEKVK